MSSVSAARFEPYQGDVLFLLVGANPLPNYVAALLLAKETGVIYLLHTPATGEVASRLEKQLAKSRPSVRVVAREVDEADEDKINARMAAIVAEIEPGASIGLNYTGGTKPMAVHVYHALRQDFPAGCFSYLDARSLRMFVHRGSERTQQLAAGQAVQTGLSELFSLHGYFLPSGPLRQQPLQPTLCHAIAEIHKTPAGRQAWREWLTRLGAPSPMLRAPADWPGMSPFWEACAGLCAGPQPTEAEVAVALGFSELRSCSKFFCGEWLEEFTLDALNQIADRVGMGERSSRLVARKAGERTVELDVAAMRGYQLFAISCINSDKPDKAKEHLMELFVRARQMGGDEARFALVCYVQDAKGLQREVEQTWDAQGKIRVFGQSDVPALAGRLQDWFETANKEVL